MRVRMIGVNALNVKIKKRRKEFEKRIVDSRREVTEYLVDALLRRTPVWSGDTAGSFYVANGVGSSGRKHTHKPNEPGTNRMALGGKVEMYAPAAWAMALNSASAITYDLESKIIVGNDSDIWAGINAGTFPKGRARNRGGVSDIAIDMTKGRFPYLK